MQFWKTHPLARNILDSTIAAPRGRNAMLACVAGSLLIIFVLSMYRPSINYVTADPRYDAMRAFAYDDTRYLAVQADPPFVPLPPGQSLLADDPVEVARDIRFVTKLSGPSAEAAQNAYLRSYNATMKVMVYKTGKAHIRRPTPISRPIFALEVSLAVLPMLLTLYLRYRLGPYRRDGSSWTADFLRVLPVYLLPRTYTEAARPLLLLLWVDYALIIPWLILIVLSLGNGPLQ